MDFNYADYRHHLAGMGLTSEQEQALMDLMWQTTGAAAEKAWGYSPIQNIAQENAEFALRQTPHSLDSNEASIQSIFTQQTNPTSSERLH